MKPADILSKAPALTDAVNTFLLAKAYAQAERAVIDKMQRDILNGSEFHIKAEYRRANEPSRITDPKLAYLMSDSKFAVYHAECQRRIIAMGYDVPQDHCPALIAERLQTEAEHAVIEASAPLTGLKDGVHALLCNGLDKYHQYVDLCVKMVMSLPGYVAPKLQKA